MRYKRLEVSAELPECINDDINMILDYLNSGRDPGLADIYMDNMDSDLKSYIEDLGEDLFWDLRLYYVKGGILEDADDEAD